MFIYQTKKRWIYKLLPWLKVKRGKVIGEFVCDEIICCQAYYGASGLKHLTNIFDNELQQTCLTEYELFDYIVGKEKVGTGWLWHISDLKIYDKPRELGEFKTPPCEKGENACANCKWLVKANTPDRYECECYVEDGKPITRAPQSWQYVEEI